MADTSSPGGSQLLLLPRELRNNIYRLLFYCPDNKIVMPSRPDREACSTDQRPFLYTEILSTCRQTLTEVVALVFAALSNTRLYLELNVAFLDEPSRAFLERYGSAFQYIKIDAIDFERNFPGKSLFSGLRRLEIRFFSVTNDLNFGTWAHLDNTDHTEDECQIQLQGACIENAIWQKWDAFLGRQYEAADDFCFSRDTFKFLSSKYEEDRDFGLVASTGLYILAGGPGVFIVSPAPAVKEIITDKIRNLSLIWTRGRC